MDNELLLLKIMEIEKEKNFLEKVLKIKRLEKEYKKTKFFKETRIPLFVLVKEYKMDRITSFEYIMGQIQKMANNLDLSNLMEFFEQFSADYQKDLEDGKQSLKDLGLEGFLKTLK